MLLSVGAGLLLRTVANLDRVSLGFDPSNLLVFEIDPTRTGYEGDRLRDLYSRLLDRLRALPGVSSASLSDLGPYFLEYDDERSGDFSPLRFVPENKTVVLGVVTSKRGDLEDKNFVIQRIKEAAKYMPLENMCLSPQCGFSSTVHGNELLQVNKRKPLHLTE